MKLLNGIGLGTFPLANPFSTISEDTAHNIVRTYLDLGGIYIHTSPIYAFGNVEILLGKVLKDYSRDKFFINTSCGYVLKDGQFKISGKYKDVIEDCEGSLKRLGINEIDLYMSHLPDTNTPFEETMGALEDLRKQGKIKNIGVSNVSLEQLKEYNKNGSVSYLQNRFSLLNQNFDKEFTDYCKEHNIGILAYQVIERGLLTNKVIDGIKLREGDLRNKKPEFSIEIRNEIGEWVRKLLKPIADKNGIEVSALAIRWAVQRPYIALCLCGATNEGQVRDFMKVSSLNLNESLMGKMDAAYDALEDMLSQKYGKGVKEFMGIA